jgi:radical SAM protein with 4Fe4S-binding SPASM domain
MDTLGGKAAERLLDDVADMGVEELLITGGEPLEREDLPVLIDALRERRQRWSLNTARAPRGEVLRAMRSWPPCFAAVSLDGPAAFHDASRGRSGAFDESLEAIRALTDLTSGRVAAGTTVTRRNYPLLAETFGAVLASGATCWGLHLVVPEGRARNRADMTLTACEVRGLIRFTSDKRAYFPVVLADELGYCGAWEPLVRDAPFFCGAGRTQCVVLPNGDVAPCTTFDPRERQGNVRDRPLSEIWTHGFEIVRRGHSLHDCEMCRHAAACGGGCWLQRRHGVHCHRHAWERPLPLSTVAGMAVCFGLAGCTPPAERPEPPRSSSQPVDAATSASATAIVEPSTPPIHTPPASSSQPPAFDRVPGLTILDAIILRWYVAQLRDDADTSRLAPLLSQLGEDPARPFVSSVVAGEARPPWPARAAQLSAAMETHERSLHLVSLIWRDLATWCFDGPTPDQRSTADAQVLQDTVVALEASTRTWRQEIFERKLHPFLLRDEPAIRRSFLSKAGAPPALVHAMRSASKHFGVTDAERNVTHEYLEAHPFAVSMTLQIQIPGGSSLQVGPAPKGVAGTVRVGVFDVVRVLDAGPVTVQVADGRIKLSVRLPSRVALTHPDLLRLTYDQNRAQIDAAIEADTTPMHGALILPALRQKLIRLEGKGGDEAERRRVRHRLADAWLF